MDRDPGVTATPEATLREVMGRVLEVDPAAIHEAFGPDDAPLWDSLNHLQLVTSVEEAFGLTFSMEEIEAMRSFGDVLRAVERGCAAA